jgi:hypothetical protein
MDEIELRVFLGRLLQHLTQMVESSREAQALVQNAVRQADAARREPLPPTREMIISAFEAAGNVGLARAEIIAAIHRDYGIDVSPDTVTTTLLRMQKGSLVTRRGLLWFLR